MYYVFNDICHFNFFTSAPNRSSSSILTILAQGASFMLRGWHCYLEACFYLYFLLTVLYLFPFIFIFPWLFACFFILKLKFTCLFLRVMNILFKFRPTFMKLAFIFMKLHLKSLSVENSAVKAICFDFLFANYAATVTYFFILTLTKVLIHFMKAIEF